MGWGAGDGMGGAGWDRGGGMGWGVGDGSLRKRGVKHVQGKTTHEGMWDKSQNGKKKNRRNGYKNIALRLLGICLWTKPISVDVS